MKICYRTFARQVLVIASLLAPSMSFAEQTAYVAIIIDDLGNSLRKGEAFVALPAPLTLAILPHTAHAKTLANAANNAKKEVMIHMPMANVNCKPIGPGGLTSNLAKSDFLKVLAEAIEAVPYAQGINNHTGSFLTTQKEPMRWLMSQLKQDAFFFIDSRTTKQSVALDMAIEHQVASSSRDVFLDNDRNHDSIDAAFKLLLNKAKTNGTAIAIGHPYPETLAYLQQAIPTLNKWGIELVPASELIQYQKSQQTKAVLSTVLSTAPKGVTLSYQ